MQVLATLLSGLVFGLGLLVSGMVSPAKVVGFLDIFGDWDPSLAVVMIFALAVTAVGYRLFRSPLLSRSRLSPTSTAVDRRLILGAILFGAGWGLVGLCPGPAIENLVTLSPRVVVFVAAMAVGMLLHRVWSDRTASATDATSIDG